MAEVISSVIESIAVYLCLYSGLKIDPRDAATLIYFYAGFSSLVRLLWNVSEAKKKDFESKDVLEPASVYTDVWLALGIEYTGIFGIQLLLYGKVLGVLLWDTETLNDDSEANIRRFRDAAIVSCALRGITPSWSSGEWRPFWRHIYFDDKFAGYRSKALAVRFLFSLIVNEFLAQMTLFALPAILMKADDDLEFVKDATSILFIAELDSLQNIDEQQLLKPHSRKEAQTDNAMTWQRIQKRLTKSTSHLSLMSPRNKETE